MASSYVEVRESENGTEGSMLQFEINPCESNGIDVPSHIDAEPPKDHTYNKDPEVVQEVTHITASEDVDLPEDKKESSPDVKKSSRNAKNTKQKATKLRTVEKPVKAAIKKDSPRKTARIKITAEKQKEIEPKAEDKEKVPEEPQEEELSSKADSVENESVTPVATPVKKRNRKRKAEENPDEEVDVKKAKSADIDSDSEKVEVNADKKEEVEEEDVEKKEEPKESKSEKPDKKSKVSKEKMKKPTKETKVKNSKKEKKEEPSKAESKSAPSKKVKNIGTPDASLPDGWTRKIVERKSGKTAGMIDIYIYSPEGIKFRSRPDIAAYLAKIKSNLKVEDFNFTKRGLTGSTAATVKPTASKKKTASKVESKVEEKTPSKVSSKPKKKSHGGSNSVGKKGQKLLVKLNVTKKRVLSDSKNQKEAKKSKPDETKSGSSSKGTGGNRRKK